MRSLSATWLVLLLLVGITLAQYQDGGYEGGNSNSYPRSQYDSNEGYAPRSNSNNYARAPASYPKANRGESHHVKPKTDEEAAAEEEEKKPSALELLLANSKFSCSSKKDGYYADSSVGCQVFHYCVGGAKHSWMCPEGTVFHQVHLNCVPAAQDICSQSEKYHIVNDYLHKPIEQNYGPNQTVRYHQRYYPEEFLGDPNIPSSNGGVQQYPPPAPSSGRPSSGYNSRPSSYNSYEDENSSAYRAAPAYSPPVSRPSAPKPNPSLYSSYPPQPKPALVPKKPNYSSYPASAGVSAAVRQRQPSYDSYDDNSFKPSSGSGSYGSSGPSSYPSRPSAPPSYKPSAPAYQPYSAAAAAAPPSYKPTVSSSSYRPPSPSNKPSYSAYQGYQGSGSSARSNQNSGYETSGKPYDYSGVTYEEDY